MAEKSIAAAHAAAARAYAWSAVAIYRGRRRRRHDQAADPGRRRRRSTFENDEKRERIVETLEIFAGGDRAGSFRRHERARRELQLCKVLPGEISMPYERGAWMSGTRWGREIRETLLAGPQTGCSVQHEETR